MEDLNRLDLPALFAHLVRGELLDRLLDLVIEEDAGAADSVGPGDVTSSSIISADAFARAKLVSREAGVVAGLEVVPLVLERIGGGGSVVLRARKPRAREPDGRAQRPGSTDRWKFTPHVRDGERAASNTTLGVIEAPLLIILKAERIILNFLGRLCGIATLTRRYVDAVAGTRAVICETRKTTPGLRRLEKYAARCGGATLHRIGLYDAALYKDNHLAHLPVQQWTDALTKAAKRVRLTHEVRFIEVEVDTLEQLSQVLAIEPGLIDFVLLDNMPREVLRQAVRMRDELAGDGGRVQLEASGGITLSNVKAIAEIGVDRISVGAITHSAAALDVGLDIEPQ